MGLNVTNITDRHEVGKIKQTGQCYTCGSKEHYANNTDCPGFIKSFLDFEKVKSEEDLMKTTKEKKGVNENKNSNGAINQTDNREVTPCTFCGGSNHSINTCFKKGNRTCTFCQRTNHMSHMCKFKDNK